MIKWTKQMLEELKGEVNLKEFAKKYNMSEASARLKKKSLIQPIEKKVEVVKKEEPKKLLPIILDEEKLIEQGVTFYVQESKNQLSTYDKMISDLEHTLENNYNLSDKELVNISRDIGIIRRKRRLHKNELHLIENNKIECGAFIKFIKACREYSEQADNRIYTTRVLKEKIGEELIASENNKMIEELKEKAKVSEDMIIKIMELEKSNLKFRRKEMREQRQQVAIDLLKPNWKDMFNALDDETKKGILTDAYAKYNEVDIKEVKDFRVWQEILPQMLVEKKYFLRGE